jgi:chromosome segregation protein
LASITEIQENKVEMDSELARLESILEEKNRIFSGAENEILEMEKDLEYHRRSLFAKAEEISNVKNEISHVNLNIENISRKTEKSSQDINSINDNLSSLNFQIDNTRNEHVESEKELLAAKSSKEEMAIQLRNRKQELSENEEILYREREQLAVLNSKLESLKEIDKSQMASVDENIKTLCRVADIFETPREYETAIEAVLGDKLGAAVVEDNNEINKALQLIKEQNTKRSGFITVNPFNREEPSSSGPETEDVQGVIGKATKYVSVKEGFGKVAFSLLDDVVLVDSLQTALASWALPRYENARPPYFVTLEGEVLEPSGMVFGGTDKGVLKVKRQIKEIEQDLTSKRDIITNSESTVTNLKEVIVTLENEIITIDAKVSSQEKYCHEIKVKVDNLIEENSRLQKKHEFISHEINDDHREKEDLSLALKEKQEISVSLEDEKKQIEEMIRSVQSVISEKKESVEVLRSGLTEVKMELTSMREKMESINRELERLQSTIQGIDRKKEEMVTERANIDSGISGKEQEVIDKNDALKLKIVRASELQAEASKVGEILEAKTAELAIIEKREKELASELETVRNELNHVEMKKMEKSMKLDFLKEDIHKSYAIEIETAEVPYVVEQEEEEKLPQMKDKLQSMGAVSLGTIDEYEELKERYEFLTKQRDDLLQAIQALEDTIRKINRTSKKRLEEAFEALNEKFKEVFSILFGKGKAELQLTEGSILDAGIEIIAQPPGKRLQNLNLLSGGEKALTAISLLFAGFMIKPTPMCLLDEVDAPLDETNTGRFVDLLKQLAGDIQFITITHNRRTMEAADYIYGITMQEPGSSKAISMHMTEAEETAETEPEPEVV